MHFHSVIRSQRHLPSFPAKFPNAKIGDPGYICLLRCVKEFSSTMVQASFIAFAKWSLTGIASSQRYSGGIKKKNQLARRMCTRTRQQKIAEQFCRSIIVHKAKRLLIHCVCWKNWWTKINPLISRFSCDLFKAVLSHVAFTECVVNVRTAYQAAFMPEFCLARVCGSGVAFQIDSPLEQFQQRLVQQERKGWVGEGCDLTMRGWGGLMEWVRIVTSLLWNPDPGPPVTSNPDAGHNPRPCTYPRPHFTRSPKFIPSYSWPDRPTFDHPHPDVETWCGVRAESACVCLPQQNFRLRCWNLCAS